MADLDLYSELVEEEVTLDDVTALTDPVRNYILSLQAQKTALETEVEALSTQVNRLEVERSQNLAVRDQITHNFWLLALVCRREIFKFKQRVQYLSTKARVPEPTYAISTTDTSSLNPETPLGYTEIRSYLLSYHTPDKSQSNSLAAIPRPKSSSTEPVAQQDVIQVIHTVRDPQSQQEVICSRPRRSSSASTSSSGSSSSGSSSGSSSSSSSSSSANSRSVSRSSNRESQPVPVPVSRALFRTCPLTPTTRPDHKPAFRRASSPVPNGQISSRTNRRIPSPTRTTKTDRYNSKRSSRSPPDKRRTTAVRTSCDRTRTQSSSLRQFDRGRMVNANRPSVKSRLSIEHRIGAREPVWPAHSNASSSVRDRKRPVETKSHELSADTRRNELRSPSPKRRNAIQRTTSSSLAATEPQDLDRLKDHTVRRTVPRRRTKSRDQSASTHSAEETVMCQHLLGLVQGSVRQARDHHAARRFFQPTPKPLDHLVVATTDQSTEAPLVHSGTVGSKTPEKELITLYTKRLRSRLENSHGSPPSSKAVLAMDQSVECDETAPLPTTVEAETHGESRRTPIMSPIQSFTLPNEEHLADSPSTLPDRVPEPLLETFASPVLSEPIAVLSTSPVLNHSYVDEPVIDQPVVQQSTLEKRAQPSSLPNSNDNWSSFDEEGGFDGANEDEPTELASPAVDNKAIERFDYEDDDNDEAKEEGEIGDELDDEEDDKGGGGGGGDSLVKSPYSSPVTERHRSAQRHRVRQSWSRSPNRHESSNRKSGSRVSSSRSPPDRRARRLASHHMENHASRRQTSVGCSTAHPSNSPRGRATSGSWKPSGFPNRPGHSGKRSARHSRSPSPHIPYHSKLSNPRYKSPTDPRSPTNPSSHKHDSLRHCADLDVSTDRRRSASIRDRNRSPHGRDPFPSGASRRSSDPLRSDGTHSSRDSLPCPPSHRSDRHSHFHSSPPRSKPRFDRDRDVSSARGRRLVTSSKLQPYSRTTSNLRHPTSTRLVGNGPRPRPRRF